MGLVCDHLSAFDSHLVEHLATRERVHVALCSARRHVLGRLGLAYMEPSWQAARRRRSDLGLGQWQSSRGPRHRRPQADGGVPPRANRLARTALPDQRVRLRPRVGAQLPTLVPDRDHLALASARAGSRRAEAAAEKHAAAARLSHQPVPAVRADQLGAAALHQGLPPAARAAHVQPAGDPLLAALLRAAALLEQHLQLGCLAAPRRAHAAHLRRALRDPARAGGPLHHRPERPGVGARVGRRRRQQRLAHAALGHPRRRHTRRLRVCRYTQRGTAHAPQPA
mmetsp:Transcript_30748/g.67330  ORF Transcript_30748/g.67330 Transcript_30748/m.67330 type:complete len:282 (+) Transcript_30748:532-1377(+)